MGDAGVRAIHQRVAAAAEPIDWQTSARHYLASGAEDDARRILTSAIETILATGAYAAAQDLVARLPAGELPGAAGLVLQSRLAQQRAAAEEGRDLAERAWAEAPNSTAVLLNLVSARTLAGDVAGAVEATLSLEDGRQEHFAQLGRLFAQILQTSLLESVESTSRAVDLLTRTLRGRSETHHLGVCLLNQAYLQNALGDAVASLVLRGRGNLSSGSDVCRRRTSLSAPRAS